MTTKAGLHLTFSDYSYMSVTANAAEIKFQIAATTKNSGVLDGTDLNEHIQFTLWAQEQTSGEK